MHRATTWSVFVALAAFSLSKKITTMRAPLNCARHYVPRQFGFCYVLRVSLFRCTRQSKYVAERSHETLGLPDARFSQPLSQHICFTCWFSVVHVTGSAKRWTLGCVNSLPVARGSQEAGFTQPRAYLLADHWTKRGGKAI